MLRAAAPASLTKDNDALDPHRGDIGSRIPFSVDGDVWQQICHGRKRRVSKSNFLTGKKEG